MSMPKSSRYTVDQYLAIDRMSEERYIYVDGEIYAMSGESGAHGDIAVNTLTSLASQLKGTPCRARDKDTKVRSGPEPTPGRNMSGLYSYPDIVVICGEPEYHDHRRDIVLNPKAIVEILSPSTEAFDRGEKFARYRTWNPTLDDYLLVSQDQPRIEHFRREEDGGWKLYSYTGLEAVVEIPSIKCSLKLADVYYRVGFPENRG